MLNSDLPATAPYMSEPAEDLSDIPFKKSLQRTFVDSREPPAKSPSPTAQKIADIDLQRLLSNENLDINDIEPLAALTIFDFVINYLIRRDEFARRIPEPKEGENSDSNSEEDHDNIVNSPTPMSPRKSTSSISSVRSILDCEEESEELKLQRFALAKRFLLKTEPGLSSTQYLERINRYCQLSTAVYLSSCFYIYKIVVDLGYLKLTRFNVHRLIIAALRISCKTIEDINHRQQFISKIGGVKLEDLSFLEISFLFLIKFQCQVDSDILTGLLSKVKRLQDSCLTSTT